MKETLFLTFILYSSLI